MTSHRTIKSIILSALVIASGFCLPSFAHDRYRYQVQEWRAAPVYPQEIRTYDYIYYPSQQVYFSPSSNNWFWAGGNGWQISTRLPNYLNLDLRAGGVPISLHSERPYFEHDFVERSYGRPWRESYESRSYNDSPRYNAWQNNRHHEYSFNREHDRDERQERDDRDERHERHDRDRHHGHNER